MLGVVFFDVLPEVFSLGLLGAAGLCVHSVFDGVAIGISVQVNPKIGLLIALAIIAHDFSAGDERLHQLHR